MYKPGTLFTLVLLVIASNAYAKRCDLDSLPPIPQIPPGATATKEEMIDARNQADDYEDKATKMMKSCKGKPEFMTLLDNSYKLSTKLDREMSIFQNRSEIDIGGIRGGSLK